MIQIFRQYRIFIFATVLIIVLIVLSIDGSQVYLDRRKAQNAADTAALAAALARLNEQEYLSVAIERAAINGYNNDGITNSVEVYYPPITGPYAGGIDLIQVIITSRFKTKILGVNRENKISAVAYSCPQCMSSFISQPILMKDGGGPVVLSTPTLQAGLEAEFANVDELLKQSTGASLAYNKPESMTLDETVKIELLLNPSITPKQLSTQITEAGTITTGTTEVTPRMTAYLYSQDSSALVVQPLHENPEQLVGETSTTKWSWSVKAVKGGTHTLTLKVFRLVKYEGKDYWREVEAYDSDIHVKVSFNQLIKTLDWKWILPTLATALLIPAFWRWFDKRKQLNDKQTDEVKSDKKTQNVRSKKSTSKKKK